MITGRPITQGVTGGRLDDSRILTINNKVLLYLGGFSHMGGIEIFARDFLLEISSHFKSREIIYWGKSKRDLPLICEIQNSGARIFRSFFRWGCRWKIPDYFLLAIGFFRVKSASLVIFKRPPPLRVLVALKNSASSARNTPKFVMITPYRPSEYWKTKESFVESKMLDAIIVQCADWKADLYNLGYAGRIEVIPLFPPEVQSPEPFPMCSDTKTVRIGFLGRLEVQKNLPYLFAAFKIISEKSDFKYELHIFGNGSKKCELQQRANLISNGEIKFYGEISRGGVSSAIDSCDFFVNPSITEGQCLAALEILSRGRPIVATPVGALPNILSDTMLGSIVPLDSPIELATAIVQQSVDIRLGLFAPEKIQSAFLKRFQRSNVRSQYISLLTSLLKMS